MLIVGALSLVLGGYGAVRLFSSKRRSSEGSEIASSHGSEWCRAGHDPADLVPTLELIVGSLTAIGLGVLLILGAALN